MNRSRRPQSGDFCGFPTTHWTLVHSAGGTLTDGQRQALNEVLVQYWPAIRAHLVTRQGIESHEADDLVQGFVKDRVLEGDLLAAADRDRGRLRSLLTKALENYVNNELRRRHARKRRPERAASLDAGDRVEPCSSADAPPRRVEAEQARDTLADVLARMREECQATGRQDLWDVFQSRIVAPIMEGAEPVEYDELVRRHGFSSTAQAQNALVTTKRMFCRTMRSVLREIGIAEADVDAEIRELQQCLSAY